MATTATNVLFKRGLQQNLPGSTSAVDGVFYLTTDTNRLYVGQQNNLRLLNQTVQIVDNISDLQTISNTWDATAAHSHINDFFYCSSSAANVLVVWTGSKWQQINQNTDTVITGTEFEITSNNNVATIDFSVNYSDGRTSSSSTANFALQGIDGITVSNSDNNVILSGNQYSIATPSVTNNVATITLGSNHLAATSGFALKGGNNVTLAATGTNQIAINAVDTVISGAEFEVSNGTLDLVISQSDGVNTTPITATLSNVGVLVGAGSNNVNGQYLPLTDTTGKTAAQIYTKDEIDAFLKGLDGMTYKGTIASSATVATVHTLPTTGVRRGDVYVVSDNRLPSTTAGLGGNVVETVNELSNGVRIGDMFIASGTENSDGFINAIQWTYIPSGNDSADQFTYSAEVETASNLIGLHNALDGSPTVMEISVTGGTQINVTSSSANNNDLAVTINHAAITTTSTSAVAASNESFSAVDSITVDNGHITAISTKTFNPSDYGFTDTRSSTLINSDVVNGTRVTTATNAGLNDLTIATNLLKINSNSTTAISSSIIKMTSSSIKLEAGSNDGEVVMNLEWGTF